MTTEQPRVTIIVLTWNNVNITLNCLESLRKISYPNYSIIVVDNCSEPEQLKILESSIEPSMELIKNDKNYGFAEGNNIGIREAFKNGSNYCVLLNNDTIVESNFLIELVKIAQSNSKIGMVAPKMLKLSDNKTIDNLGITLTLSGLAFNRKKEEQKLFCPSGGAALYKIEMLKKVALNNNYFDSDYFAYAEDLDLGFRGLLNGYKAGYSPKSVVYHQGSTTSKPMSDFHIFHNHRNLLLTIIKNYPLKLLLRNIFWILLLQIGILLLYIFRGRLIIIIKANIDVCRTLLKTLKKRRYIQKKIRLENINIAQYIERKVILNDYLIEAMKNHRYFHNSIL